MATYRVWVEKHESGWVRVDATSEDNARDRAQDIADHPSRCLRWPEHSHATPLTVEVVTGEKPG